MFRLSLLRARNCVGSASPCRNEDGRHLEHAAVVLFARAYSPTDSVPR